jgi:hypothetical protein
MYYQNMARLLIDTGTAGNPATGDTIRTAMTKINTNFAEVYSLVRDGSSGLIATDITNGDLKLQANGTGNIEIDQLSINGDSITSIVTNGSVDITGNGTGGVNIEALTFNGTSISSTDSSRINLNENVTVDGDLLVTGSITGTFTVSSVDADSTTVSNLEVDNFKASAIVIESEGISSNDNDTTLPTSAAVKDYVDTNSVTASGTATFTNKTFDANGTGNSISNIEVADFAAASIVTEAEGIGSNDNDTTIPTSAAVKDYVDARDIGDLSVVGSTISAPSNADLTLTTSGTGSVSIDGIQVSGTELSSSDSTQITIKENLHVTGNITGTLTGSVAFSNVTSTPTTIAGYGITDAASATATALTVVGDDSSGTAVTLGETFKVAGATGVTTAVSGDTLTVTGPDLSSYLQNTGTQTIDNLSFNDNIISTSSNADLNLDPGGTGNVKILTDQITLGTGSSAGTEAVAIGKNTNAGNYAQAIGNNAGNSGQGQGAVALGSEAGETNQGSKAVAIGNYAGETTQGANAIAIGEKAGQTSQAANSIVINATGAALNNTTASSMVVKPIRNASGTHQLEYNPTTGEVTYDTLASGGATGDLTITGSTISSPSNADLTLTTSGAGSVTVTGGDLVTADISSSGDIDAVGFTATGSSTFDGVQITDNKVTSAASNANLELDASGTGGIIAQAPMTFNAGYIEKINALTSSSTITVNCALASIHTVTLATATEFNITNLPTGGSVTLIITQDGTGSRTATFGTDGSTAVKFSGGTPTLSTAASAIDIVTILNDGTNYLGNLAKAYAA